MADAMDNLISHGWLVLGFAAWVALAVGSFLNVVIYRLPIMLQREFVSESKALLGIAESSAAQPFNLAVPHSRCPHCEHVISPMENIPVLSWLVLQGRCRSCRHSISPRYPLVEFTTLVISLVVISTFGFTVFGVAACVFSWVLLAATMIDADTMLLPDQLTLPLLWLGLLVNLSTGQIPLETAVIGAAAGYLLLWSTYWGFKLATGREGMGYGDFKLLAALGAWLGWQMLPAILLLASMSGLVFAILRMIAKNMSRGDPMPFGPFLAIAGWLALTFNDSIRLYMGLPV